MDLPKILEATGLLFDKLTWRRVGMVTALVLLAMIATTAWLARDTIIQVVKPSRFAIEKTPLFVDEKAKRAIEDTLRRAPAFVAIGVVSVNMPMNTRRLIYFSSLDPVIDRVQKDYADKHPAPDISLFSTEDAENNKRVIALLNGEMVCLPLFDSRSAPFLKNTSIKHVCAVGTPPWFGSFRGSVIAYLNITPTAEDILQIRVTLRALSSTLDTPHGG